MLLLRRLYNEEYLGYLAKVVGNPEIRTLPLQWQVFYRCQNVADETGPLGDFLLSLDVANQKRANRALALLARAAQTRSGPADPAHGLESHEVLSFRRDNVPYTGYEFIAGPKVRMLWFYSSKIAEQSLVLTHGFVKKSQKTPVMQKNELERAMNEYIEACQGPVKEYRILED